MWKNHSDREEPQGRPLEGTVRRHAQVTGTVQGVGFRPFVYRLAAESGLSGWVRNDGTGVQIEIEGPPDAVEAMLIRLRAEAPPLSRIGSVSVTVIEPLGRQGFSIGSSAGAGNQAPIPPDAATCEACLSEMRDPHDRRFRYPFINCTHCGPRYTIIESVPYDRPSTTMAPFEMCPDCRAEYENPADRRFHAEPIACPACGPAVALLDSSGSAEDAADPVKEAVNLLESGHILAVKGLGGFHLACDASNEEAVQALRSRKGRREKPFAIMAADLPRVLEFADPAEAEIRMLLSVERPVVFVDKREPSRIAPSVAPRNRRFGAMLPYTPLHHLLLEGRFPALVMTSGNLTDEPIAYRNEDAVARLRGVADAFLVHDRDIRTRADDSVTQLAGGREIVMRRSRGFVPRPVLLPGDGPCVLAVGADLKNVPCLTSGGRAYLGHYIGDLEHLEARVALREAVEHLRGLLRAEPEAVAHDLHPEYASTRFAMSLPGVRRIGVQHHHAHVASVLAERGIEGSVIGVAFDGTGYGEDGTIWGGEFLLAWPAGFARAAHLSQARMPGGDAAAREGWRMAVAHMARAAPETGTGEFSRLLPGVEPSDIATVRGMISMGLNSPLTSSMGRLFDAVSALAGVAIRSSFEGQAAMELEGEAGPEAGDPYAFDLRAEGGVLVADPSPLVLGVVRDRLRGVPSGAISARFHSGVAAMTAEVCARLAKIHGLDRVVLSGGCFQNARLLEGCLEALEARGLRVFTHALVPPNDGGIALGQAFVALARIQEKA